MVGTSLTRPVQSQALTYVNRYHERELIQTRVGVRVVERIDFSGRQRTVRRRQGVKFYLRHADAVASTKRRISSIGDAKRVYAALGRKECA